MSAKRPEPPPPDEHRYDAERPTSPPPLPKKFGIGPSHRTLTDYISELENHLAAAQAENARLKEALEAFVNAYDEERWPIENDVGLFAVARAALNATEKVGLQ